MNKYLTPYRYVRKIQELQDNFGNQDYIAIKEKDQIITGLQRSYAREETNELVSKLFDQGKSEFTRIIKNKSMKFPLIWNSGENLSAILYTLVKIHNPKVVFETGVANGISSEIILKGISNQSTLHSFDIDPNSRFSVQGNGKWEYHLLSANYPKRSFKKEIKRINSNVDIWLHDSDHSKYWQSFEYKMALKYLNSGGILISDDINTSSAWNNFFRKKETLVIEDGHKKIGIFRKSGISNQPIINV